MTRQEFLQRFTYDSSKPKSGGFSDVFEAWDNNFSPARRVALKFFTKHNELKYDLKREINTTIGFNHANIGKYLEVVTIEDKDIHGNNRITHVAVLEYYDGGNVKEFINEERAKRDEIIKNNPSKVAEANEEFEYTLDVILIGILKGLNYLNTRDTIHRDIKPENILVTYVKRNHTDVCIYDVIDKQFAFDAFSGKQILKSHEWIEPLAKIIDFGISKNKILNPGNSSVLIGTLPYMAPEQIEPVSFGDNGNVDFRIDIWSFGVVGYELVTGEHLFSGLSNESESIKRYRILTEDNIKKINALPLKYRNLFQPCLIRKSKDRADNYVDLISKLKQHNMDVKLNSGNPTQPYRKYPESNQLDSIAIIERYEKYAIHTIIVLFMIIIIWISVGYFINDDAIISFNNLIGSLIAFLFSFWIGFYFIRFKKFSKWFFIPSVLIGTIPFLSWAIFMEQHVAIFSETDYTDLPLFKIIGYAIYTAFYLFTLRYFVFKRTNVLPYMWIIILSFIIYYFTRNLTGVGIGISWLIRCSTILLPFYFYKKTIVPTLIWSTRFKRAIKLSIIFCMVLVAVDIFNTYLAEQRSTEVSVPATEELATEATTPVADSAVTNEYDYQEAPAADSTVH